MPPPVHYARSGDLSIAYQVHGSGPVDVVWTTGATSNLDLMWEYPGFVRQFDHIASYARLLIFDKRGTGLSDRPDHLATLEERIDDIRSVMDAAGSAHAHILGISEGGAMCMLFAATYPDRTRSLIAYGAPARYSWAPDWPWGTTDAQFEESWRRNADRGYVSDYTGDAWRRWAGAVWNDPLLIEFWERLRRSGGSPAARKALAEMNRMIDVRGILPAIAVPTLVVVREDDPVAPLAAVRSYAAAIPEAKLAVLPGQGHLAFDIAERWLKVLEEWVTGTTSLARTDRFLATVVSADIVGSTQLIAKIGDQAWRDRLDRHYALASRALSVYGGHEVDRAGDGMLARFDGPGRAISWARALQSEDRGLGLETRAGVHTGEVERAGSAIRGIAVHIAARLGALAAPGEVLVSSTVRDLVAGSGFTFVDRGMHELKGVPEPKQVFAVA